MISIRGVVAAETTDDAYGIVDQVARDATAGSFERFPPFWSDRWETPLRDMFSVERVRDLKDGYYEFHLLINSSLFPIRQGGLQHLVGVLAGDTFFPYYRGRVPDIQILDVSLPTSYADEAETAFRSGHAHTIEDVRALFGLDDYAPLIAFSFKPRVGVTYQALEEVTLGVLKAGFHIVELDTRNLIKDDETARRLVELAAKAADLRTDHVTRFSPNLTLPAERAVEYAEWFYEAHDEPVVVKVDGALDGLSTCQAIRTHWRVNAEEPAKSVLVTSYPLLRTVLAGRVPHECFNGLLALSGVDIMYPGNRPNLGIDAKRQLDTAKVTNILGALKYYRDIIDGGYPMPTVAGGIYAGQLHAWYELMGPSTAYFLGGGVALHKDGPFEGARLCARILNEAAELRRADRGAKTVGNIQTDLIEKAEGAYVTSVFPYISPADMLEQAQTQLSWFAR